MNKEANVPLDQKILINEMFKLSINERERFYNKNYNFLQNYIIMYVDKSCNDIFLPIIKSFEIKEGKLIYPFYDGKIRILSNLSYQSQKISYILEYDILYDTQIVSYISKYEDGKECTIDVENLNKTKINHSINMLPYITENLLFKYTDEVKKSVNKTTFLYNYNFYKQSKVIFPKHKAKRKTKELINKLIKFPMVIDRHRKQFLLMYAFMLKMVFVSLKMNLIVNKKLEEMVKFCHYDLKCIMIGELNLSYEYFKNGQKLTFFSKIHKGRKNLLRDIRNMTWDLFHLYLTIENTLAAPRYSNSFLISVLYTIDKRLIDVSKILSLEGLSVNVYTQERTRHYKNNIIKYLSKECINTCLTLKAQLERNRDRMTYNIEKLNEIVFDLEKEFRA